MTGHKHHDHQHDAPAAELTPGRRRILDVLAQAGRPLGAYEMIDRLAAATGKRPAPISIYRALDFLVDNGFVHRLASRNAFLACGHGHAASEPVVFLICDTCGEVKEVTSSDIRASLDGVASEAGFRARSRVIELAGECARCALA
jgi:Fur family zinc uptake transcriptional regulator